MGLSSTIVTSPSGERSFTNYHHGPKRITLGKLI